MNRTIKISQQDNYAGNFGNVYRSSAIFYYKQDSSFKTTITLMDYWSLKRKLNVWVLASLRSMNGDLIVRETISFDKGKVKNYCKKAGEKFEGSLEIEVFSNSNMVIPYSAIMAVYESENSISMVHSYGRIYSPHEVEENRTIVSGEESCWTIRDTNRVRSFCVFHNGFSMQPRQDVILIVTDSKNEKLEFHFTLKKINPYSTIKLIPQEIIGEKLINFLNGKPGNISISFNLNSSFTRMLVGNETKSEFQITHSNFNYSKHETDTLNEGMAYMHIPISKFNNYELIIYPDSSPGNYVVEEEQSVITDFTSGRRLSFNVKNELVSFSKKDGNLPSRIVTALSASPNKNKAELPFECSLGVIHKGRPKKSTFWGIVSIDKIIESRIFIIPMYSVYGECSDQILKIKLFTEYNLEPIISILDMKMIKKAQSGLSVSKLFPNIKNKVNSKFAWFYFKSESYGGFMTYSSLELPSGSITLEHSF